MWQHASGEGAWFVWFGVTIMSLVLVNWVIWLVYTGISVLRRLPVMQSIRLLDISPHALITNRVDDSSTSFVLNNFTDFADSRYLMFDVWLEHHAYSSTIHVDVYLKAEVTEGLKSKARLSKRK